MKFYLTPIIPGGYFKGDFLYPFYLTLSGQFLSLYFYSLCLEIACVNKVITYWNLLILALNCKFLIKINVWKRRHLSELAKPNNSTKAEQQEKL